MKTLKRVASMFSALLLLLAFSISTANACPQGYTPCQGGGCCKI
ncbi:hypothetical protein [Vibrio xiamenensis]|nr:hypothetical protein [Vibrio xiamenensis]